MKYTQFAVKKNCRQVQLLVDMRQIVVLINIMHKSGQSFSSNKKRIIIVIVKLIAQEDSFSLEKKSRVLKNIFVVCFCHRELPIIFLRSLI